jgi:hypothetical protein
MIQQGQVFELKRASPERGPLWAYRVGSINRSSGWEPDLGRSSEIERRGQGDATVNLSVLASSAWGVSPRLRLQRKKDSIA